MNVYDSRYHMHVRVVIYTYQETGNPKEGNIMATYTAIFHTSFALEIEANDYEEAMNKLNDLDHSDIIDGQDLSDMWPEFDELLEY